ncbi:TPA: DUF2972 domain-containing protein [Campylobacter jejuni]|nr:DUF2972 domain-containing protein [Campylobacter jejuni]ECO5693822.1 DUF2972 domain-containing protein [Campylobacter jejuni]EDP4647463.1 DUF2972 domain-containing protein [Campylobacter jejuni]HEC2779216.1 DUF2972 domain-containing protein [Campylobacter jejuni]HEF4312966.1 DUF2972 domain-containing protein [Campylobacter jejuni]
MYNPNSAIDRIKNSLSYKIGFAILEHKKQYRGMGRGYIILLYKLYKIKQQHFKEQKLYKQTIKIFPHLTYPRMECCKDYNESIKYKYHFSYMLGEALIKAHKTWYKGGYFKLYKNIQNIKKQYNLLKELNLNNINISLKNKELLIKNIELVKDILQLHRDYKPILKNIFHNFDYALKHLELIKEWLLSDNFYQRYKKENHPYPSLLDPKKLNDKNEKINYKNISAELAWDMNLPIGNKQVWLMNASCGLSALNAVFLKLCNVNLDINVWMDIKDIYYKLYTNRTFSYIPPIAPERVKYEKILYLLQNVETVFYIVRDPISILKHGINHINNLLVDSNMNQRCKRINLTFNYFSCFPKCYYAFCENKTRPDVKYLENCIDSGFFLTIQSRLDVLRGNKIKKIECLEMLDINFDNAFNTFVRLSDNYGDIFQKPSNQKPFSGRINRNQGDLIFLPVSVYVHAYDLNNVFDINNINPNLEDALSFELNGGVNIIITTYQIHIDMNNFINITNEIFKDKELVFQNIILLIQKDEYEILKNNKKLFLASKKYLNGYMDALEKHEKELKRYLVTEKQILSYLKSNNKLRIKLRNILDRELAYIKKNHPEYINRWKYYQEFEKMCKELDGDI